MRGTVDRCSHPEGCALACEPSSRTPHRTLLLGRSRDDRVSRAVPNVAAVEWRPFLIRLRHHRLPLRIEHEHSLRGLHQARAAPDAAVALHAHHDPALRENSHVAGLGPFILAIERGAGRAIALLDLLAQMIE